MSIGRPTQALSLTDEERDKVELLARRPKSTQAMAQPARIVLNCAAGLTNKELRVAGVGAGDADLTLPTAITLKASARNRSCHDFGMLNMLP
jgi:hypothetical protein